MHKSNNRIDPVRLMELWYKKPVREIAEYFNCSESKVYRMAELLRLSSRKKVAEMQRLFEVYDKEQRLELDTTDLTIANMKYFLGIVNQWIEMLSEYIYRDEITEENRGKFITQLKEMQSHRYRMQEQLMILSDRRTEDEVCGRILDIIGERYPDLKEEIIRKVTGAFEEPEGEDEA